MHAPVAFPVHPLPLPSPRLHCLDIHAGVGHGDIHALTVHQQHLVWERTGTCQEMGHLGRIPGVPGSAARVPPHAQGWQPSGPRLRVCRPTRGAGSPLAGLRPSAAELLAVPPAPRPRSLPPRMLLALNSCSSPTRRAVCGMQ